MRDSAARYRQSSITTRRNERPFGVTAGIIKNDGFGALHRFVRWSVASSDVHDARLGIHSELMDYLKNKTKERLCHSHKKPELV